MSKIGKKPIQLPSGVKVSVSDDLVSIAGPKGTLTEKILPGITVKVESDAVHINRSNEERATRAFHGLVRSLIANDVKGVADGYKKTLKLVGTGYRVSKKGQGISLSIGFSHPVDVVPPQGIALQIEGNDTIHIEGISKQQVGEIAAQIRKKRPPEPYKGKGIRYDGEVVKRKQGKAAVS